MLSPFFPCVFPALFMFVCLKQLRACQTLSGDLRGHPTEVIAPACKIFIKTPEYTTYLYISPMGWNMQGFPDMVVPLNRACLDGLSIAMQNQSKICESYFPFHSRSSKIYKYPLHIHIHIYNLYINIYPYILYIPHPKGHAEPFTGRAATHRARGAASPFQPSAAAQQKNTAQLKLLQAVKVDQRLEERFKRLVMVISGD